MVAFGAVVGTKQVDDAAYLRWHEGGHAKLGSSRCEVHGINSPLVKKTLADGGKALIELLDCIVNPAHIEHRSGDSCGTLPLR